MIGRTISHYRILEKLGEGGMGVVYKARDTKLDRDVAMKCMPAASGISEADRARFLQEARAAATLNHPNVCTIHGIEEHDGALFIVMELIEGGTLRSRVPITAVSEALAIVIQAAEALRQAHARGIVHRDVKSDNIMLTSEGRVKVMDFGLAKLRGSLKLTKTSATVGTTWYMAPEQLQGAEADARSDLFSLGVVLYELLAGIPPFRGEHEAAVMYSIVHEAPGSLSAFRNDVPPALQSVIDRALRKDPDERYGSMEELLTDLRRVSTGDAPPPMERTASIAVLAFGDMSPGKDQEHLCEGLAEEIINALTKIKALRVSSRTSAFAFKGRSVDIREIGAKLNVSSILEGSIQKSGNRLRISVQLVNVSDGYQLWSERFDREMKDVFEIQDEITASIVDALELVLTGREKAAIAVPQTPHLEAYEFYLRGRRHFARYSNRNQDAIGMFRKALEIDPSYALAWCGLAEAYAMRYLYWEGTEENLAEAERASRRAVELNPDIAETHAALGFALSLRKNFGESDLEFDRAISRNPQLYDAYWYYARTCFSRGQHAKAARLFSEAVRVRPEDYQAAAVASSAYLALGEEPKYRAMLQLAFENALRQSDLDPGDARALYMAGTSLYQIGDRKKAESFIERALAIEPDNVGTHYNIACMYGRAKETDKAFECLEKAVHLGFSHPEWIEHDPDLDPLRGDPRYEKLLGSLKGR